MNPRYVFALVAAVDPTKIWNQICFEKSATMGDRVESVILERIGLLATNPGIGHPRPDITRKPVRFFPVYSNLIVFRPEAKPLQIIGILHGHRNVSRLKDRL